MPPRMIRRVLACLAASATLVTASMATGPTADATPPTPLFDYSTSATFNGTSDFVDHTSDLASVSSLSTGTIVARFQTTSTAVAKTILSASDTADASSNLTLSVNNAGLHYEVRDNNGVGATFATNLTYPTVNDPAGSYNDGREHTVAVSVGAEGTRIFADGHQVYAGTSTAFFDDVTGLDGLWVGRNVDNTGGQWFYNGTIASVQVYDSALSPADVLTLSPAPATTLSYAVNQSFDGTSTYVDKTADLSAVSSLAEGTIAARFQTSSSAAAKVILSLSDVADTSSNITLSVNNGALYFESRQDGAYATRLTAAGTYNDGAWHTVAVTVGPTGTIIYADGYRIGFASGTGFVSNVTGLDGMWIGRNVDNGGGQWYFDGTIDWVKIYSAQLNDAEVKTIAGTAPQPYVAIFDNGYAGSANYRIPSLMVTAAGTLIAGADQRTVSASDSPNDINLVVRRSTDGGATWGNIQTLLDYPGTGSNAASAIDSVMVQDSATGRIHLLVDHFPGGVGQPNNVAGIGFDANGHQLLTGPGGATFTLRSGGQVYNAGGTLTSYSVDAQGNVTNSGAPAGNIYLKDGVDPNQSLLEARTSFLKHLYSDDDGVTWSSAIDLNAQVKESWMKFLGTSPGNGIEMEHGTYAGRLVMPVYYNNASGVMSTAVVFSDDNGATWQRGESPNDGRVFGGSAINSQTVTAGSAGLHEGAVTERADGSLVLRMRNSSGTGKIAVASSTDGGATWGAVTYDNALPDVFCQPSALTYPSLGDGISRVLFGNTTRTGRQDGFIRLSLDGGTTWKHSRNIKAGGYAYNSIAVLPGGDIAVLWELQNQGLYFSRLPLSWLTDSRS